MNPYKYFVSAELINNPLCGIDTYKDILNLATGAITRKIKKLVFDGTEDWYKSSTFKGSFYATVIEDYLSQTYTAICTHAVHVSTLQEYNKGKMVFNGGTISNCNLWFNQFDENTTVADFKAYLAAQYAAGTPVTIWYVLSEPETETIAVPTGLSGTVEGYLNQSGTPTPTNPIYPTANTAKGWYNINAYKRSVLVWNTDTAYERSGGSWSSSLTKKRSRKKK